MPAKPGRPAVKGPRTASRALNGAMAAVVVLIAAFTLQSGSALAGTWPPRPRFPSGSSSPKTVTPTTAPKAVTPTTPTPVPPTPKTVIPTPRTVTPSTKPKPVSGPVPSPRSKTPPFVNLVPGAQGAAVLTLQHRLQALGYWLGTANGDYNLDTAMAVTALQKAAGIQRDGIYGPKTAKALAKGVIPKARSTSGKVIEVSLASQLVLIVDNGVVEDTLDTSTGGGYTYVEQGQTDIAVTPPGHYQVYYEVDGWDHSPLGYLWRPKFFNGGIAIHGYDYVPAYPASHGCVRISIDAANWIWSNNIVPLGTPVWVY
jgi:peptidoglycan hydrolase-like protein with peptidoglycan-binding domain